MKDGSLITRIVSEKPDEKLLCTGLSSQQCGFMKAYFVTASAYCYRYLKNEDFKSAQN